MKKTRRLLAIVCCIGCLFAVFGTASAQELTPENVLSREADPVGTVVYGDSGNPYARNDGLIRDHRLFMTKKSSNQVVVNSYTEGATVMNKVGFKYITIQRYENGTWRDYWRQGDVYLYNATSYNTDNYVSLATGYQYRAVVDHYAEKSGWWIFADSQTIHNDTTPLYM